MGHTPGTELRAMDKAAVMDHLKGLLEQRAQSLGAEIAATLEARNSDTKSSAGDKHEVGRALVQQELDRLEARLHAVQAMQQELARVPLDRAHERAGFGSLVTTDRGCYFIAIALGAFTVGGADGFALSLASPLGRALQGKCHSEDAELNGQRIQVLTVA